jgi:hypothetical protein
VTGRVSYIHIEALTLALHQPPIVARLMPFGVDGLIVVGSVALLQAPEDQRWLGWLCVGPGALASLFANVESGLQYGPLAAGWAGMASVGFFLATFTLERWLKGQAAARPAVAQGGPALIPAKAADTTPGEDAQDPAAKEAEGPPAEEGEPDGPATPDAALRALVESGSRRMIADLIGVPKTRVDRWAAGYRAAGGGPAQAAQDDDPEAIRDAGSAADGEPLWSAASA